MTSVPAEPARHAAAHAPANGARATSASDALVAARLSSFDNGFNARSKRRYLMSVDDPEDTSTHATTNSLPARIRSGSYCADAIVEFAQHGAALGAVSGSALWRATPRPSPSPSKSVQANA